jgi:chemotaxis protein MotB
MSSDKEQPIVIKKGKKHKHEAHGGAWKIAYADFVTAMMAFFMLMWLLSLLNKYQLQGVAQYFQRPLKEVFTGSKRFDEQKVTTLQNVLTQDNDKETLRLIYPVQEPSPSKQDPEEIERTSSSPGAEKTETSSQGAESQQEKQTKDMPHQEQSGEQEAQTTSQSSAAAQQQGTQGSGDQNAMHQMQQALEAKFKHDPTFKDVQSNVDFKVTNDGLKISLHDSETNQMFEMGSAQLKNTAQKIVSWLSGEFNNIPQKIVIIGHTDALQYGHDGGFTNWELSADRANAARQLIVQKGMHADKVLRIEGASDINLFDKHNPYNPNNRRVDIILLTDQAASRLVNQ